MPTANERAGVCTLRVWREDGPDVGLRVRIVTVDDVRRPAPDEHVAASVDDVVELVRAWLHTFLLRDGDGDATVTPP